MSHSDAATISNALIRRGPRPEPTKTTANDPTYGPSADRAAYLSFIEDARHNLGLAPFNLVIVEPGVIAPREPAW